MRRNLARTKNINEATRHDIKLELDVRCQKLIERTLRRAFPTVAILGEEGILGDPSAPARWVVDPIDGTVNFTYGIPHACVSIALQVRDAKSKFPADPLRSYTTLVGVVYDPFLEEMWTAVRGQRAKLNGKPISVSGRARLDEAIVAMGFAKYTKTLALMLPVFNRLVHRVRKVRLLGAAALPAGPVQAQSAFPTRPITMVVPLPAGGTADLLCRFASEKASVVAAKPVTAGDPSRLRVCTPRPARFSATLPAPPTLISLRWTAITGAGASGEIRLTSPYQ